MPKPEPSAPLSARLALAALLTAAALAGPAVALVGLAAPGRGAQGPVLAVAPPWADLAEVVEGAGGRPVGPYSAPVAMLADGPEASFPARLKAEGAWLALDGRRLAQLCGAAG